MGVRRLPRDPEKQKAWARKLGAQAIIPPICCFRYYRESIGQYYPRIFRRAFEIGAVAALRQVLQDVARPDDPCAGLPPHLVKSARAAKRARERKAARIHSGRGSKRAAA